MMCWIKFDPMKPAPPVTRSRTLTFLSFKFWTQIPASEPRCCADEKPREQRGAAINDGAWSTTENTALCPLWFTCALVNHREHREHGGNTEDIFTIQRRFHGSRGVFLCVPRCPLWFTCALVNHREHREHRGNTEDISTIQRRFHGSRGVSSVFLGVLCGLPVSWSTTESTESTEETRRIFLQSNGAFTGAV